MKFVTNPKLILSKGEFETLDKALTLCRDMDSITTCESCPFNEDCSHMGSDCVYARAYRALKDIIDIAIVE